MNVETDVRLALIAVVAVAAAGCSNSTSPLTPARTVRVLHDQDAEYRLYEQVDGCLVLETRVGPKASVASPVCDGQARIESRCFRADEHARPPVVRGQHGRSWVPWHATSIAAPRCDKTLAEHAVWGRIGSPAAAVCAAPRDAGRSQRAVFVADQDRIVFGTVPAMGKPNDDAVLLAYTRDGRPTPLPLQEPNELALRAGCFEAGPWTAAPPPALRYPFALRIDPALKRRHGSGDTLWVTTDEGTYVATAFGAFSGEWQGIGLELDLYRDTTHLNVGYGEQWPPRPAIRVALPAAVRAALASGTICNARSPILTLDVGAGVLRGDQRAVTARAVTLDDAVEVDPLARELAPPCVPSS